MEMISTIALFGLACFLAGYGTGAGRFAGYLGYRPTFVEKMKTILPNFGRPWNL